MDNKTLRKVCKLAKVTSITDLSNETVSVKDLTFQKCILVAALVNLNKDISWKSKRNDSGELCSKGEYFIVGIETPEGPYTFHSKIEYWELFHCKELEKGKYWDGKSERDIMRLLSLEPVPSSK